MPPDRPRPTRGVRKPRPGQQQSSPLNQRNPLAIEESPIEINVEDIQSYNPSVNVLINGELGVGKTVLAGGLSALADARVVFCSTEEEGIVSAKRAGSTAKLIRAPSWEHAVAGLKWGTQHLGPNDWMVFDSGTRMHYLYMRWIMEKVKAVAPQRDQDTPGLPDHQKLQNGFMRWYDEIVKASFNSVMITSPMILEGKDGEEKVIPGFFDSKGKVSRHVSAQASVILYYDVQRDEELGKVIRRIYAQPWPPYLAKDRYSALGPGQRIEEGDFFAMARYVEMIYKAREETIGTTEERRPRRPSRPRKPAR